MKVLTAVEMREADRRTIERGIPGLILMENAAHRVVEFLERTFTPLAGQRIVVICGKGNNGGDGLAIARQMLGRAGSLDVVLSAPPEELSGDAAANYRMLYAAGGNVVREITPEMRAATIVVDALLGTGIRGHPAGRALDLIRAINDDFPRARKVAVDLPSGLGSGQDFVYADYTITFTAPKLEHYFADTGGAVGKLVVAQIGNPPELVQSGIEVSEARDFAPLFRPRPRYAHKGMFGHVLIVGGASGRTGAAAMAGLAALRAGAGLVTVASSGGVMAPELMSEPFDDFRLDNKTVVAVGPGLGLQSALVRRLFDEVAVPLVVDADGLNSLAGSDFRGGVSPRVLTPHPGEMGRLIGAGFDDRLATARDFSRQRNVAVVLKGYRTIVAFPRGAAWINPTGSPALAKGGTGDVLTGMIAGLIAQAPAAWEIAVRAAVWLHGRSGELAAEKLGEQGVLATDLFRYFPQAIHECLPN